MHEESRGTVASQLRFLASPSREAVRSLWFRSNPQASKGRELCTASQCKTLNDDSDVEQSVIAQDAPLAESNAPFNCPG